MSKDRKLLGRRGAIGAVAASVASGAFTPSVNAQQAQPRQRAINNSPTDKRRAPDYYSYALQVNKYTYKDNIIDTHNKMASLYQGPNGPDNIKWGNYQEYIITDNNYWGSALNKIAWNGEKDEVRRSLQKQNKRVDPSTAPKSEWPNPSKQTNLGNSWIDQVDEVIKFALVDNAIPIEIKVTPTANNISRHRQHSLTWKWSWNPPHNDANDLPDLLTLTMTCRVGGWVAFTHWDNPSPMAQPITSFQASWKVPEKPQYNTNPDEIAFIFNGLESFPGNNNGAGPNPCPAIVQPVLQFAQDADGNWGWAVRCWYVPQSATPTAQNFPKKLTDVSLPSDPNNNFNPNNIYYSTAATVTLGAIIQGVITASNTNAGWLYKCQIFSINRRRRTSTLLAELDLKDMPIAQLTSAAIAIEAYSVADYKGYPGYNTNSNKIDDIDIESPTLLSDKTPLNPSWEKVTDMSRKAYTVNLVPGKNIVRFKLKQNALPSD